MYSVPFRGPRCPRTRRRALPLRLFLERLEDRTVPTGWSKIATADGFVLDNNRDGFFDSINTTSTSDQTTVLPAYTGVAEERAVLEFYIGDIPRSTTITSARILGNITLMQYNSVDGGVDAGFHGYAGDGYVRTDDGNRAANQVGLLSRPSLGQFAVTIDPNFIQSLLNAPTPVYYAGFTVRLNAGERLFFDSTRRSGTGVLKPTLQLNYDQNTTPTAVADSYTVNEETTLSIPAPGLLANDVDPDGDALSSVYVSSPSNASSFSFITNGAFNYTPRSNFSGTDTFTYKVFDGIAYSDVATVTITVRNINDAPVAWPDNYTIGQDTTLNVTAPGVLANDRDVENDPLTATLMSGTANGTLTFNADGSFTYVPLAGFHGLDRFTYRVNDGTVDSNTATVTITVNDPPVVNNDSYSVNEDTTLSIAAPGLLANDTDLNGDTLTAYRVAGPSNGTLTLNTNGSFTYVPRTNYSGTDSFTYRAWDGRTYSGTNATVTLTINPVNDPPTALSNSYTVNRDATLNVAAPGVLANDSDVEGSPLTAVLATSPANGTVTLNADGSFTYVPSTGYVGNDSFTYRANDSTTDSNPATVTIKVNGPPVASNDSYTIYEDSLSAPGTPGVLANDTDPNGDALTAVLVTGPSHGTLTLNANGSFQYRPSLNYNGTDSFTYRARDGSFDSNVATVTFTILAVNDGPTTLPDSYSTNEDTPLVVAAPGVKANDSDPEGDTFSVYQYGYPTGGTVSMNSDGSFTYTPYKDFSGVDRFTYQSYDSRGAYGVATTVTITVNPVNDAPVAANDSYVADQDRPLTITVASGITSIVMTSDSGDYIGQGRSYNLTSATGSIGIGSNSNYVSMGYTSYTNSSDYWTLQFAAPSGETMTTGTYLNATRFGSATNPALQITGQHRGCNTISGQFTVTQLVRNAAGQVVQFEVNFEQHCEGGTPALRGTARYDYTPSQPGVLFNDRDVDKDTLTASLVTGPANGTLSLNSNGTFTYTPAAGFFGYDSFTYRVSDGQLTSNTATATIKVRPPGTAPVAANDSYTVDEDTVLNPAAPGVLANDRDAEGETLSVVLISAPRNGTVTLNADGSFRYTPTLNFNGSDRFTYRVDDPWREGNIATVSISVNPVNDPPTAASDYYFGTEDVTLNIAAPGVLYNDSDVERNAFTAVLVAGPANGTLTFNTNGSFTYVPRANFYGTDSFTYQATDGALSNVATVTLFISGVNDPPVAMDDAYTVDEDGVLSPPAPGVLANDTDVEGFNLRAVLLSGPTNGTLTLNTNGSFTYTPRANFFGSDSFTYQAREDVVTSNTATVRITVTAVNDAPVAGNNSYGTSEDTALTVAAPGVLANDSDVEGSALTAVLVAGPAHGTLTLNADGSFTYTPAANYNGPDAFTYRANDGAADSNVATVALTITATNDPPTASPDAYSVAEDGVLTVAAPGVLGNDTGVEGPLTAVLVAGPVHGTLTLNADGSFTYTPAANYNGADSFSYKANDGISDSNVAVVNLTVSAVNDPPTAGNDSYATDEDTALTIAAPGVLANDGDADGDALTAVLVAGPAHGTLTLNANGSFTYTPTANYNGADSFTYRTSDGVADSNVATVTLTVRAVNDAPVAGDNGYTTSEDTALTVAVPGVLANDSDADGDALAAILVSGPANGTLSLNADGSFTYTPAANFHGSDSFTYRASDGTAASGVATVTLTVTAVNDVPTASGDSYATDEDTALTIAAPGVLANDGDADGDPLTAVLVAGPAHGTLTLSANGSFTYTPAANYNGADSFSYRASDGAAESGVAVVSLTIRSVNDAPLANAGSNRTAVEGEVLSFDGSASSDADGDALTFTWSFGDGSTATGAQPSHAYADEGVYTVTLTVSDGRGGTGTASLQVTVANVAPTLTLSGAASVQEASVYTLRLAASDPGQDTISRWVITWGDGTVETVAGNPSAVTHVYADGPRSYTISATATDEDGTHASNSLGVQVTNVAPTAGISGPGSGVRGQELTVTLTAADPSAADQGAGFTFQVDWGDGTQQTVTGASGQQLDHVYSAAGTYSVRVTATDRDGGVSSTATHAITIAAVALQGGTLAIGGTTGADTITVQPLDRAGTLGVTINGVSQGSFVPTMRILVYGQQGNDTIQLLTARIGNKTVSVGVDAMLHGGDGDDTLDARGSTADDILMGGLGNDNLSGGAGRDLLIGGLGADILRGGDNDDLLIGGTTAHDDNEAALLALLAEWSRTDASYSTRLGHLDGSLGGGLNGGYLLTAATVFDDAAIDQLFGEGGQDWFFATANGSFKDVVKDRKSGEVVRSL